VHATQTNLMISSRATHISWSTIGFKSTIGKTMAFGRKSSLISALCWFNYTFTSKLR